MTKETRFEAESILELLNKLNPADKDYIHGLAHGMVLCQERTEGPDPKDHDGKLKKAS